MKWLSTKTHRPPSDATYFVHIEGWGVTSLEWFDNKWNDETGDCRYEVTHFIIPDALEIDD